MRQHFIVAAVMMLFITSGVSAQDFQGKAYYESKTNIKVNLERRDIPGDRKKKIQERMRRASEKTYILTFNQTRSIYKEQVKLEQPGAQQRGMRMAMMMNSGGEYFKNIKDENYVVKKDLLGKKFLIMDKLERINWKMEGESKKIGNYTVFKATATKIVKEPNMAGVLSGKETPRKKESKGKEVEITAWYCPEIPVNQGPASYWGLPGLIMEVSDGRTTILCSKIIMNPKEKSELKAPYGGKIVNQDQYNQIAIKKMEELKQTGRFQKGPGGGRGGMRRR